MVTRIGGSRPPRLYIEEWMATIPGLDRMRLAKRMGVSPGTVTKKLAKPASIDGEWLAKFAAGLELRNPIDLFRDPSATPEVNIGTALRSALVAYGVDRDELDQVIRVIGTYVSDDEKSEQTSNEDLSQPANPRHGSAPSGKRPRQPAS